ncbi:snRNA-activating protein complex subunit 3 isoform X2 [Girardinichthys multiradiatus]|uniref:snRNA-activating protein complex subunit 3 isoform X2 n=1 Tax=Girardinichthys multiradiatus TaxID=208333 RepID=UPI001FAC5973|nr:snRNA-activating protein complex subunit 3 isoform X2 [Girardinichthys multiradiatus]
MVPGLRPDDASVFVAENMAASKQPTEPNSSIPEYEFVNVNTKPFHIGSFRDEWLKRLQPRDVSFQPVDQDTFEASFAAEMGLGEETMAELRSVCRLDRLTVGRVPETEDDMIPEGEVILTINIYFPGNFEKFNYVRPHMTLLMTGSHTLAELRDAICCVSDLQVCGEFSSTPDMAPDFISKDIFKSAFFFFEGVFYNDMRYPECQDISSTTIKWTKSQNFPSFSQAKMEDTRFMDLKVKVGFPYLYCHQGDCEHLVIITDVRLVHKGDCLDRKLYPLLTHKNRVLTQKCAVCHVFISRWYTTRDQFAPSDPCLFCDKCFRMLHYDKEGNKLGEFLAYPYVDRGAFN